jgi:prepilin-type N-terminal cleavage/methylation domain-containing protein
MDQGVLMRNREGFSLVEVIVALVVLAVAILGSQSMATTMIRTVSSSNAQSSAAQLVEDRIDRIRTDPSYDSLTLKYPGTENPVPGWNTFQRLTEVVRTQTNTNGGITDYTTVTVTVSGNGLLSPIKRTVIIGSP